MKSLKLSGKTFLFIALAVVLLFPLISYAVDAELSGVPSGLTNQTNPVINVGGNGVVAYRFKLDSGDWSGELPATTPISFTADVSLAGGQTTAGSAILRDFLDDRIDFIDSVSLANVAVDTPVVFLLNKMRVALKNDNILYIEGSGIDQLEVYMNDSPTVPAVVVEQSFATNPQHVTYALHTDTPQTDYIRILNHSGDTASFKINLNNKLFAGEADVLNEMQAITPEFEDEPLERKAWRFIRDNRYDWWKLTVLRWETASPALFFNSIGFAMCGDTTMLFCQMMTALGYQTRMWWLEGHVVPEVLINGRWEMYDSTNEVYYFNYQGQVAGVEELAAHPDLITNPINPIPNTLQWVDSNGLPWQYSPTVADIFSSTGNNVVETWNYDYSVANYSLNLQIPSGGVLEFPSVFGAPIHTIFFTEIPNYTNARLTVPAGWSGPLDIPFVIHSIGYEGAHTLSVVAKDSGGNWQTEPTVATWTTDSWLPITTPTQFNISDPVTLTVNETATIYYTTDGGTPTTASLLYQGPIDMSSIPVLKFFAVDLAGNTEPIKCYSPTTGEMYLDPPSPVTGLTVTPDKSSPQIQGTIITFTAAASGGSGTYEYMFWFWNPNTNSWSMWRNYSALPIWRWNTAGLDAGQYTIQVWARNNGSTAVYEVYDQIYFNLNVKPVANVTLIADKVPPQVQGASITFTASASGGSGTYEYYYWLWNPNTQGWIEGQANSSNPTWVWNTTGLDPGRYYIQVWARSKGASRYDVYADMYFRINSPSYAITASVTSGNGGISCIPVSVVSGSSSLCTISPAEGWHLQGLTDNLTDVTSSVSNNLYSIFNVTSAHAIAATFAINTYAITTSAGANGSITCMQNPVDYNTSTTCTIDPDPGYSIGSVTIDGLEQSPVPSSYVFNNVQSAHSIAVAFAGYPVKKILDLSNSYYFTIQPAYTASSGGDVIQALTGDLTGDLVFDRDIVVTLSGGYQAAFSAQNGFTTVHGTLIISSGSVTVENLIIE